MQTQIDPIYHVTGFHKGQDFEGYHMFAWRWHCSTIKHGSTRARNV